MMPPGMMPPGMGGMGGMGMGGMGMGYPGMGGMGGMMPGMGYPGMGMPQPDPMAIFQDVLSRVATGLVSTRVRNRALLELLEAKGVFAPGEFDARADEIWKRDHEELTAELLTIEEEQPAADDPGVPPPPPRAGAAGGLSVKDYAEALVQNVVNEAVAGRVRLRAIIDILEAKGIFAPGEFDAKADEIWDRDYEELTLDFYKMKF